MSKLLKLSDTHYIIVDDSEIKKEGVICYSFYTKEVTMFGLPHTILCKRITHSFGKRIREVDNRHISEVEELINGYSVEKMAEENGNNYAHSYNPDIFIEGFKAHQELAKDKLFTIEDMRNAYRWGTTINQGIKGHFEEFIQPLLPKTEWEVEFDEQGKLIVL